MKTPDQWAEHQVPWMRCPYCGDLHDYVQALSDKELPKDGDANICIRCARISVFDHSVEGTLRIPTGDEMAEIAGDKDIITAVRAVRIANIVVPRERAKRN